MVRGMRGAFAARKRSSAGRLARVPVSLNIQPTALWIRS
jgi:hypothetical protein